MKSKNKFILSVLSITFLVTISGCTAFLAGAGTIGIGMDTTRLERFTDYDTAWNATIDTLNDLSAAIEIEDKENNQIQATMADYKIKILVQKSGQESVFVDVTVRKKGLPNLSFADKIIEQINTKIRQKDSSFLFNVEKEPDCTD
ncbi:MAG: DUF3568 family protein [Candidatus Omnitrophica bacterium]|nr:DUF3568 family protein [Candidatus Omnitrophota bacterium]